MEGDLFCKLQQILYKNFHASGNLDFLENIELLAVQ